MHTVLLRIITISLFFINFVYAKTLNFVQATQLRQTSSFNSLAPIRLTDEKNFISKRSSFDFHLQTHPDTYSLYQDLRSKNNETITNAISEQFGQPHSAFGKIQANIYFHHTDKPSTDTIHAVMSFFYQYGAVAKADNPVFPELDIMLNETLGMHLLFATAITKNITLSSETTIGLRKLIFERYNSTDFLTKEASFKLKEESSQLFIDHSIKLRYNFFNYGNIVTEINSIPISTSHDISYWESLIGFQTTQFQLFPSISGYLFTSASPFKSGNYRWQRTNRVGAGFQFYDKLSTQIFTHDSDSLGFEVMFRGPYFQGHFLNFSRYYDNFEIEKDS